jgi:hypothetical protein
MAVGSAALAALVEPDDALVVASARAVSDTANEMVREVVMAGTVGGGSNRPATAVQRVSNHALERVLSAFG